MNPLDEPLHRSDDESFDLLVDGELSEAERRELLSSLDDVPGGWRRCALAFLEAQSWKEGLGCVRRESGGPPSEPRAVRRWRSPGRLLGTLAAMAASFMLALGLGMVVQGRWRPGPEPVGPPDPSLLASEEVPAQPPDVAEPGPPSVAPSRPGDWELVTVPVNLGPDGATAISLPARETDRIDDEWIERFAPQVPADLVRLLEESGHRVRRSRRLVPFRLDDGRQVVVPFEEVEFQPVDQSAYQ